MRHFTLIVVLLLMPIFAYAQRLPRVVFPSHYDLIFTPNLEQETFEGTETISVSVQQPLREIVLNSLEIQFKNVEIEFLSANSQSPKKLKAEVRLDPKKEFAILTFSDAIPPGPAKIHIEFTGKLNRELRGFYIGDPVKGSGATRKYAASQGEATDNRRAFPSFDEPEMKATYSITMIVNKNDTAISNAAIASDIPGPASDQHTIRFADTPRLSSYLVALLAGDFHCIKDQVEKIPLGICGLQDQSSFGHFAMDITKGIISYYDKYYGIQYPFGKLDQIGIPDFSAGAMENAGAIVYRESALFVDPKSASLTRRKAIASVVAHEIAHMWFGDLVTMKWWNDIWLNEGFATWMSSKPLKTLHPEWRFDLEDVDENARAMNTDVLFNTRQIRANAETSREIDALFDSIAYQKTASLLRMIESYMGEKNFQVGVNNYLETHSFDNAESFDFFEALAINSHTSADEVMNSFVNQPGVPVISVAETCDKNETSLRLQQRRFLESSSEKSAATQHWSMPICLSVDGRNPQCQLLREKEQSLRFSGCKTAPVFLNHKGSGYFITEYQPETETKFLEAAAKLEESERMVFSRDEWYLIMAGERPVNNFLKLSKALQTDRTPQFLETEFQHLQFISDYFIDQADTEAFHTWMRSFLQPIAKDLGISSESKKSEDLSLLRGDVWKALAKTAKDPDAIEKVRRMADDYLRDRNSLDSNMVTPILEGASAVGDAKLYEEIVAQYKKGGTPEEVRRFLYTLAEFRDPDLLEKTMAFALTDGVRSQDKSRLMRAVIENPAGSKVGWDFVKKHWDDIEKQISDAQQLGLVQATSALCDQTSTDDVKAFFTRHPVAGSDRALAQSLEKINICVHAKTVQQKHLDEFLSKR
jgi:aminopeptidase N